MFLHVHRPVAALSVLVFFAFAARDGGAFEDYCNRVQRETNTAVFQANQVKRWRNPGCYSFTFQQVSMLQTGPVDIKVRRGVIVEASNHTDLYLPTMQEILDTVYQKCIVNCPAECNVVYGIFGQVRTLFIDESTMYMDEETRYTITNFKPCGLRAT